MNDDCLHVLGLSKWSAVASRSASEAVQGDVTKQRQMTAVALLCVVADGGWRQWEGERETVTLVTSCPSVTELTPDHPGKERADSLAAVLMCVV